MDRTRLAVSVPPIATIQNAAARGVHTLPRQAARSSSTDVFALAESPCALPERALPFACSDQPARNAEEVAWTGSRGSSSGASTMATGRPRAHSSCPVRVLAWTLLTRASANTAEAMRKRSEVQMAPAARNVKSDPLASRSNAHPLTEARGHGRIPDTTAGKHDLIHDDTAQRRRPVQRGPGGQWRVRQQRALDPCTRVNQKSAAPICAIGQYVVSVASTSATSPVILRLAGCRNSSNGQSAITAFCCLEMSHTRPLGAGCAGNR